MMPGRDYVVLHIALSAPCQRMRLGRPDRSDLRRARRADAVVEP
jgi:hypothetical protein